MTTKLILALDQGTTSSRSILFNRKGSIVAQAQEDFEQIFPNPGWVEHNPMAIWRSQLNTVKRVLEMANVTTDDIAGIGITNQRETTVVWDKNTGEPIYNAIVWQDRRTAEYCKELKDGGDLDPVKEKTGLILDAYFSATKIRWILDHVPGASEKALKGDLCFGTIDTWLIWKMTNGEKFITDVSNASRTMLYNINSLKWDEELLSLFGIPNSMLPEVRASSEIYGNTSVSMLGDEIPIAGIAGDQQAALFGQLCVDVGMVKNTYGTGCFLLMNTGDNPVFSDNNLLTTIAWQIDGKTTYALEGSVFVGGAVVQWLRDGINIIDKASQVESLAKTVPDNGDVYFVPALTGMGAPYWDPYARGAIFGITRGTKRGHIARAALEGIAYQVYDLVKAMEEDSGTRGKELRVDGGASANNSLLQFQSDIFNFKVIRPEVLESTALGAAYLAGLALGYWSSIDDLRAQVSVDQIFWPKMDKHAALQMIKNWHKAVSRSRNWAID
jgi:glycerol kinase